jgi:hypothetical protein
MQEALTKKSDLAFRPAQPGDAAFAADVDTAVRPSGPRDPRVYEYWWAQPDENWVFARFVVSRGERRVGYAIAEHPRWDVQPERYGTVDGNILPPDRTRANLDTVFASMEERVLADGAKILSAYANEDDALRIETLLARAYKEEAALPPLGARSPREPREADRDDRGVPFANEKRRCSHGHARGR